jgi:uncharacterized protein YjbI with pentapeptide repeats
MPDLVEIVEGSASRPGEQPTVQRGAKHPIIVKETRLEVAHFTATLSGAPELFVVVKGTFQLENGKICELSEDQDLPGVEVPNDGDALLPSLRYDSDFALVKPRGECFLAGTAWAPREPCSILPVEVHVGSIEKRLGIIGDREWKKSLLGRSVTDPEPFQSMPLRLERCFGGEGFDPNPIGRGFAETGDRWLLPNIEDPAAIIDSPRARPRPASAFPTPRLFPERVKRAGTFDERWKATRWPDLPEDFDPAYFNAAPEDLQIDGFWRGDETIVLVHLHPEMPRIDARLPGLVPRCFVEDRGTTIPIALALDTITVDSDRMKVLCVWRGRTATIDPRWLFLGEGSSSEAELLARFADRIGRDVEEETIRPARVSKAPLPGSPGEPDQLRAEVATAHERGESLARRDLTGVDLSGLSLERIDLSHAILTSARFDGANLSGANLEGAVCHGASARATDLTKSTLGGADLSGIDGTDARFEGADLTGVSFEGSRLGGARFCNARSESTDMAKADLTGADFSDADLTSADLSGSKIDGASFEGANLTEATFEDAAGDGASFDGAAIPRLRAARITLRNASFSAVSGEAPIFREAALGPAVFDGARIPRADFSGASMEGASFEGCDLTSARMVGANLSGAVLAESKLFEANLEGANLENADLEGASLYAAELWKAKLDGAHLDDADLTRTKLEGAG